MERDPAEVTLHVGVRGQGRLHTHLQATGTLTDGTTVNSGAVDYHFTVG
ncbi:hypothetical protein ACFQ2Y_47715 [Streptomyces malaysiensis subsp. malaysiensis]|uniref:Uncharacterized protein n=1 Tax=Streptomyces malaysiensis TaxID=92644 RepID=A0A2J7YPY2_STRMQ|nr:hypothetical protein SMF913_25545 [Streptomyces malaysiensis]